MAYSELIKNFKNIRHYIREFYVYGFKRREEYDAKSPRSYDNERRRLESWLGDYMSCRQDATGKQMFFSVDSRRILHNPFYEAFKTKSFTKGDLLLHFYILDILEDKKAWTVRGIIEQLEVHYLSQFENDYQPDESTVRGKLQEYEKLGIITSERLGREKCYRLKADEIDKKLWLDTVSFFSEATPMGVIGSYFLDRFQNLPDYFGFKHHYMLHVLDSEVLLSLLNCISEECYGVLEVKTQRNGKVAQYRIFPLKIYISTQSGRQYLLAYSVAQSKLTFFRLDNIQKVTIDSMAENPSTYVQMEEQLVPNLWGVAMGDGRTLEHLEMVIRVGDGEGYMVQRLEREKRCGKVTALDKNTYQFTADVYDALEMLPWIRTFIGRIVSLSCTKKEVIDIFYADLETMQAMYGGDNHAVS